MTPPLGRIYHADPRDQNYLMTRALGPADVTPVGQKLWDIPFLYDQGQTPDCTAYSSSAVMSSIYWAQQKAAIDFNAPALYHWANTHDGIPGPHDGSTVRAAFQGLLTVGDQILTSSLPADTPGVKEKVQNFLWANHAAPNADINSIIKWILTVSPVVIGINWYSNMFCQNPQTGAFVVPPAGFINIGGPLAGGHAICVRGVMALQPNDTYFVLRNSWGPWGVKVNDDWTVNMNSRSGDILISKANLVTLLLQQGEAGALIDRTALTPAVVSTGRPLLIQKMEQMFDSFKDEVVKLVTG